METYIIRIRRNEQTEQTQSAVGLVEDVERGSTKRFGSTDELLKMLKLAPKKKRAQKKP